MSLNSQIAELMLEKGRAQAQGAAASGQAWGSALSQIGQNVGQAIANIPRMQEQTAQTADAQRARAARDEFAAALKDTPTVEQEGVKLFDVNGIGARMNAKGYGPEFMPAAQHLDGINAAKLQFRQAQQNVVKQGAAAVAASGNDPTLANHFLDTLTDVYPPDKVQQFRDFIKADPTNVAKLTSYLAGPQKPVVLKEGDKAFNPVTNAPIPGMEVAPKPVQPTEASLALAAAGGDPGTAVQTLQAPAMAARDTAAAQATETARHNTEMEKISRLTQGREAAAQAETARHNKVTEAAANPLAGMTGAPAAAGPSGQPANPTGDEVLKNLAPPIAAQVKALAEGRQQFPAGFALKSPYWQSMISLVSQYDPSFDATNYNNRAATRKDFSSGKSAQTINALNTVAQHLDRLSDSADGLNNSSVPAYNTIANLISKASGNPQVTKFETDKKAVVDELTKAWRQSGGTESDIKSWSSVLDAASSPAQLHTAIGEMSSLLEGKLSAMETQLQQGMGKATDLKAITPEARKVLDRLQGKAAAVDSGAASAPMTRTIRNTKTGETKTQTSTDGGVTWK